MPTIDNAGQQLAELLKKHKADYIESHLEEKRTSQISYRGREMESVGRSMSAGGNIRAMVNGGWGFVSFNSLENLDEKIGQAVEQAKLAGGGQTNLAEVAPVTETVPPIIKKNPASVPLAEKKRLLEEYNEVIWKTPELKTSVVGYGDSLKRSIFISSAGSYIQQERADINLRLNAVAAKDGDVQQVGLSLGSLGDYGQIENIHEDVEKMAAHAVTLLSAPPVKSGEYTVVLDPVLAGVFVHEAFGHLSESDFVYENPQLLEVMALGKKFGGEGLNIVDSAAYPDLRGSYKYDDEGVAGGKTYLIREGKLTGRLHSRETAAKMNEEATGNARAVSYRYPPIVRMSNTYIEPGDTSFEDMIADIKNGIYVKNWYGGTTSMEMFTFSAGEAYMIRNGKVAEALRPVVLSGNVFTTLANIDAFGNDLDMNQGGGCGKGGQMPLPVSNGSPHIRIRKTLVGGA